ncbi:MAG: Oxidoreductase [Parcubacteria group bacterium]|nr:Oxidoreductase [Parcubacteria group bacterium]
MVLKEEIQKFFKGEVMDDDATLVAYSHDASLFEVRPKLVVFPKDASDLEALVKWVGENKKNDATLSLTVRAAGSCMSGGSLNESIIADVTKHMNKIGPIRALGTVVEPGVFYRDFEPKTLEKGLILPCFTASKNLNALGGMIGNNSAGEKTLRWGKMDHFVLRSKVVLSDGSQIDVKPLSQSELRDKIAQNDFEGHVYRELKNLIEENRETIIKNKPRVSKNSAGYYLWNVWDGNTFDLNKLIVGSQGTLGIVTEAEIGLIEVEPVSKLYVIFLKDLSHLAELVNEILPTDPETLESYDDATMKLAFRFFPEMLKSMKVKNFLKLILSFIPEGLMMLRGGGMPKLIVLVEYTGKTEKEVEKKMKTLDQKIAHFKFITRETRSQEEADKYWTIRRESFNLLRKHVHGSRTAPFIDDVVVLTKDMPAFLPRMREILDRNKLVYTIAGHAGNGNFHIIPLMDMHHAENIDVIKKVGEEVYDLVGEFHGSITGEHNDGIVRTPYLGKMFSPEMLALFKKTKDIFDPQDIFNPGKKVGGTIEYMASHIVIEK